MVIIGTARSMNDPDGEKITPDDRQTLEQIIGGVVVQDFGRVEAGDKTSWTLQFDADNFEKLKGHWLKRELVTVTDTAKEAFKARVLVKSWSNVERFGGTYKVEIELWRV